MNILKAGIDTGGTFTDCIMLKADQILSYKILSTPHAPALAVKQGLESLVRQAGQAPDELVHGTTVATNALLERKLARVSLMITAGFKDLVQIGRQNRQDLYGLNQVPNVMLYQHVIEIPERMGASGEILKTLTESEIKSLIEQIPAETEAIAICCLFGYAWPQHEQALAYALREAGYVVSTAVAERLPIFVKLICELAFARKFCAFAAGRWLHAASFGFRLLLRFAVPTADFLAGLSLFAELSSSAANIARASEKRLR